MPTMPPSETPGDVRALDAQAVEQREGVGRRGRRSSTARAARASRRGRDGRSGRRGSAGQGRHLRLPHRRRRPQRVGEHQRGGVGGPVDEVVDLDDAHGAVSCVGGGRAARGRRARRSSQVLGRVQQRVGSRRRRGARDLGLRRERLVQRRPAARRGDGRAVDEVVRGLAAERLGSAPLTRSASSAPPVRSRLARMRSGSTSRLLEAVAQPRRRRPRRGQQVAQRLPLGVPRAGGALVLVGHARRAAWRRAPERGSAPARAEIAADRVALVRQRRRAAAPGRALAHLADLGLREQHDVARDLADRAGGGAERAGQLGDARARRCATAAPARPARARAASRASDVEARVAERGQRARRAAELDGEAPLAHVREARRRPRRAPTSQPAALRPKVIGSACCSSVRPAIGVSRCALGQRGRRASAAPRRSSSSGPSARRATSIAAVSRTSWLVAPRCT